MAPFPDDTLISALLRRATTIAIVGISQREDRPSFQIGAYLQSCGYEIIPVNPNLISLLGVPAVASLAMITKPVHIVNVFRRSEETDSVIDDAITIGAEAVWLQLGIANTSGMARLEEAGILGIQDRCVQIEHSRLLRSPS